MFLSIFIMFRYSSFQFLVFSQYMETSKLIGSWHNSGHKSIISSCFIMSGTCVHVLRKSLKTPKG